MKYKIIIASCRPDNLAVSVPLLRAHDSTLRETPSEIVVISDSEDAHAAALSFGCTVFRGQKPFIISRNLNIGLRLALENDASAFCINDDVGLETDEGLVRLASDTITQGVGLSSAAFTPGSRAHPQQIKLKELDHLRVVTPPLRLNFSCTFIPAYTLSKIGFLDEQFVGYGYDDDDYCIRVREHGLDLAVHHGCLVSHPVKGTTCTFDKTPDFEARSHLNAELFRKKWGASA